MNKKPLSPVGCSAVDVGVLFVDSLFSSNLGNILGDSNLFSKIPLGKTIILSLKLKNSIWIHSFVKKYSVFFRMIQNNGNKDYGWLDKDIIDLCEDKNKRDRLIEETLISIDRNETEQKVAMLGVLFRKTFHNRIFSIEEYRKLLFSIESMHPIFAIESLTVYYKFKHDYSNECDDNKKNELWLNIANYDYSPLATSGLIRLPSGGAYAGDLGGARINDLGIKFYENIVLDNEFISWEINEDRI